MKKSIGMALVVGLVMATAGGARATDYTWLNTVGGLWSLTNNWSGGIIASGSANRAVFPVTAGAQVIVDQPCDVGTLVFPAGSQFTLDGAGPLSSGIVEVWQSNQTVRIHTALSAPSQFLKDGLGTLEVTNLTAGTDVKVRSGTVKSRTLTASGAPNGVELGDWTTPVNSTVQFMLTTPGDYVERDVSFGGYNNNFLRVLGGVNTNGVLYYNWLTAGYLGANNEMFMSAEAGGEVDFWNVKGNSAASLVKIGAGAVRVRTWGVDASDRSYAGSTTVRNGSLILGEDDIGTTGNGIAVPSGRTSNGAGGSLGFNDFANPVQLGDIRYEVYGAGLDIWGSTDEFHALAGALTNDGTLVTRLVYQQNTADWAKAGLMIRETLNGNSRTVMMLLTPANGATFQWRDTTGLDTYNTSTNGSAPSWLKLVRSGDTFTGYISNEGLTWTQVGTASVSMGAVVYAGFAVTSHNSGSLSKATFACVSGLPQTLVSQDVGVGLLTGSASYIGTEPTNDLGLLVADTRWVGHALQVNPVGRTISIGAAEAGTCTVAGPIDLKTNVCLTAPAGGVALFNNLISGPGGVVKTGAGTVKLAGTNAYDGATIVSNGQLRIESGAVLPAVTTVTVANGGTASIYASLTGSASLTKAGPGVLTIAAVQSNSGATVVSGGTLRVGVPGLYEGRVAGQNNTTDPNPKTSVQASTRYANSTDSAPWVDMSTYIYSGYINNSAATPVAYTFAEKFDDNVNLRIDGITILSDTGWDTQTSTNILLAPGWHTFDLRLGQGSFGVGPANGTGIDGNTGLGVAFSNAVSGGWQSITDNSGNFLESGAPATGFLSPSTTLSIASGATLDLSRSTQTVAGVSGSGVVTNGSLNVTATVAPGAAGTIGSLAVKGNLALASGTVNNWDFALDGSADQVAVSGTLTLPATATLNLNGVDGAFRGQRIVLYTFGSYSGPTDLRGWSVGLGATVKVDLVAKQVILLAPGTLLSVF